MVGYAISMFNGSAVKSIDCDEARRIAANIAKLPDVGLFSVNLSHRLRARHAAFRRFTGLPAPLAQGSQWFTIASTPWAKTVISKDHRKKLSALMIGRLSPLLCKCRMVLNLKFGTTNALSSG